MLTKYFYPKTLTILAIAAFAFGCGNQAVEEANKLVDEGNSFIIKNGEIATKTGNLFDELVGDNVTKVEDFVEYKETNKAKFDELISLAGQLEKNSQDAAAKFDAASKLDTSAKVKEYNGLKAQELKKRAEAQKIMQTFVKGFVAETDVEKMDAAIGDYNTKSAAIVKEANDIAAKGEKLMKDNPSDFKSN